MRFKKSFFILAVVLLAGCAGSPKEIPIISGYIVPTSSLVPEDKLSISVALQDVSKADSAATTLSEIQFELIPYWPLPYNLSYDPGAVDFRKIYSMRVRVSTLGGTLLATNDIQHQFTVGADSGDFDILIKPVDRTPSILSRFGALCNGEDYTIEVYEAFISRFDNGTLSRQIFSRIAAASGRMYKRETETIWATGDNQIIYIVDGSKIECSVSPGLKI
jgi:hypothetical protein